MEIYFKKINDKLIPAFDSDRQSMSTLKLSMKEGDTICFSTRKSRSLQQLKMYHSLLKYVLEHTDLIIQYPTKHQLDMMCRQLYCEMNPDNYITVKMIDGTERKALPSIALSEMSNERFNAFVDWCIELFKTKIDINEWERSKNL